MERALSLSRYIVLIGVVGLIIGSLGAFVVSFAETITLIVEIVQHASDLEVQEVNFIKLIDGFLVATGLLMFALGLYELAIQPLSLPRPFMFENLHELKASLANIVILTFAVTFLAFLQEGEDAQTILFKGAGTALVIAALIWFARPHHP